MAKKWYEQWWVWAGAAGAFFLLSRKKAEAAAPPTVLPYVEPPLPGEGVVISQVFPPAVQRFVDAIKVVHPYTNILEWQVGGTPGAEAWMEAGDVAVNYSTTGIDPASPDYQFSTASGESRGIGSRQQAISANDIQSFTHAELVEYVREGYTI